MEQQQEAAMAARYSQIIYVRATEEEKTRICTRAHDASLSASRFLVRLAMDGRTPPGREEREYLERLLFLLKRASLNLQQLAGNVSAMRLSGASARMQYEFRDVAATLSRLAHVLRSRL